MTRGLLSVPIMRSKHCQTILRVFTLALLLLTLKADSGEPECEVTVLVRRHTEYKAAVGGNLKINCPVRFCNNSPPAVSWYKDGQHHVPVDVSNSSRFKTEWKTLNHLEGASYLMIENIVRNDTGVYRCRTDQSAGHGINVSVIDDQENNNQTQKNDTTHSTPSNPEPELWMYIYVSAGILTFVIIVIIISVASMRGCKGKPKKDTSADNQQYVTIPMVEQPFPESLYHPPPRGSPSTPPPRRSIRRQTSSPQLLESQPKRDEECVYSQVREDTMRQRNTMREEGNSLVYAALNHQLPARPPNRPRRLAQETSEYAAIRVRDSSDH